MNLVIINCSPRMKAKSNTNMIINAFAAGYTKSGNTAEIYQLSEVGSWEEIRKAFYNNTNILMALPLYVECIPGIMAEFLETLEPKAPAEGQKATRISFILQSGFSEASQRRCCEEYLKMLPGYLNCEYGGVLMKGEMFVTHLLPAPAADKMLEPFIRMGELFAKKGEFPEDKAAGLNGAEYSSRKTIVLYTVMSPVQKIFFRVFFKKMGCRGSLRARPYERYIRK